MSAHQVLSDQQFSAYKDTKEEKSVDSPLLRNEIPEDENAGIDTEGNRNPGPVGAV